jgi:hypothetical protein
MQPLLNVSTSFSVQPQPLPAVYTPNVNRTQSHASQSVASRHHISTALATKLPAESAGRIDNTLHDMQGMSHDALDALFTSRHTEMATHSLLNLYGGFHGIAEFKWVSRNTGTGSEAMLSLVKRNGECHELTRHFGDPLLQKIEYYQAAAKALSLRNCFLDAADLSIRTSRLAGRAQDFSSMSTNDLLSRMTKLHSDIANALPEGVTVDTLLEQELAASYDGGTTLARGPGMSTEHVTGLPAAWLTEFRDLGKALCHRHADATAVPSSTTVATPQTQSAPSTSTAAQLSQRTSSSRISTHTSRSNTTSTLESVYSGVTFQGQNVWDYMIKKLSSKFKGKWEQGRMNKMTELVDKLSDTSEYTRRSEISIILQNCLFDGTQRTIRIAVPNETCRIVQFNIKFADGSQEPIWVTKQACGLVNDFYFPAGLDTAQQEVLINAMITGGRRSTRLAEQDLGALIHWPNIN